MRILLHLGLVALVLSSGATRADEATVRACVDGNAPQLSSVQSLELAVRDENGEVSRSRMKLYWRRIPNGERRVLLRFSAPEDLKGAGVLVEMPVRGRPVVHLYLPEIGKTQRVTSLAKLEGFLGQADLGIEEMAQLLEPVASEEMRLIDGPGEIGGRSVWVVETLPEDDDARYSRIVTFVDREYCVPLRTEFYDQEGQVRKLLRVDPTRVIREAQSWVARHMVFRDLESGSESILEIEEVEIDVPLAPSLLTVKALPGGVRKLQSQ